MAMRDWNLEHGTPDNNSTAGYVYGERIREIFDPLRQRVRNMTTEQWRLEEHRKKELIQREYLRTHGKRLHARREKTTAVEAEFMKAIRRSRNDYGPFSPDIERLYQLMQQERDLLGVVENDWIEAEREYGGVAWELIDKENRFYRAKLGDQLSDEFLEDLVAKLASLFHEQPIAGHEIRPWTGTNVQEEYVVALQDLENLRDEFNSLRPRQAKLIEERREHKLQQRPLSLLPQQDPAFVDQYEDLLHRKAQSEVHVQHLKAQLMQREGVIRAMKRRASEPLFPKPSTRTSQGGQRRAQTESGLGRFLDNFSDAKPRIKEWLWEYLKTNAVEKTQFREILKFFGVRDVEEQSWEFYWDQDATDSMALQNQGSITPATSESMESLDDARDTHPLETGFDEPTQLTQSAPPVDTDLGHSPVSPNPVHPVAPYPNYGFGDPFMQSNYHPRDFESLSYYRPWSPFEDDVEEIPIRSAPIPVVPSYTDYEVYFDSDLESDGELPPMVPYHELKPTQTGGSRLDHGQGFEHPRFAHSIPPYQPVSAQSSNEPSTVIPDKRVDSMELEYFRRPMDDPLDSKLALPLQNFLENIPVCGYRRPGESPTGADVDVAGHTTHDVTFEEDFPGHPSSHQTASHLLGAGESPYLAVPLHDRHDSHQGSAVSLPELAVNPDNFHDQGAGASRRSLPCDFKLEADTPIITVEGSPPLNGVHADLDVMRETPIPENSYLPLVDDIFVGKEAAIPETPASTRDEATQTSPNSACPASDRSIPRQPSLYLLQASSSDMEDPNSDRGKPPSSCPRSRKDRPRSFNDLLKKSRSDYGLSPSPRRCISQDMTAQRTCPLEAPTSFTLPQRI